MKPLNSSKLLTAACALSLAMGVAGGAHAKHEGDRDPHDKKGPQLSIDVEVFCGDPLMIPAIDADGNVVIDADGNVVYNEIPGDDNAAVRVTDVSADANDGNELDNPQIDSVHIMCHTAVGKPPKETTREVFSDKLVEYPDTYFGDYNFECDLDELPNDATEWKVTAVVTGEQLRRDVFDSCEEVEVLP